MQFAISLLVVVLIVLFMDMSPLERITTAVLIAITLALVFFVVYISIERPEVTKVNFNTRR